jgi:abortive infection bacteriophage resistance protein
VTQFTKRALSIQEQVDQWMGRGLVVSDRVKAERFLSVISYYRLSAYSLPFQLGGNDHCFKPGTTFDDILNLYSFDRELRLLVMDAIERLEVALRTQITNHMSVTYGAHWYLERNRFKATYNHQELIKHIGEEITRSNKEKFLEHYQNKYCNPALPPSWMVTEVLTIGKISKLFENLSETDNQKTIARCFNVQAKLLFSWFQSISYTRNLCAHHSRLWNRDLRIRPQKPDKPKNLTRWIKEQPILSNSRVYFSLVVIEYLLQEVNPESTWHWRLKHLMEKYPKIAKASMGMPDDWFNDEFWRFQGEPQIFNS